MYSEKARDGFRPVANTAPRDASDCCKQERVGVGRPPGLLFPPCDRSSFRVASEREKERERERERCAVDVLCENSSVKIRVGEELKMRFARFEWIFVKCERF